MTITFKDEAHSADTNHSHGYTFYVRRIRSGATANVIGQSYTTYYNQTSRTISQNISAVAGDRYYLYVYTGGDVGTTISSLTWQVTSS